MRFANLIHSRKPSLRRHEPSHNAHSSRRARFESLERRDLLALSVTTADYRALAATSSFGSDETSAIWVSSLDDVVNVNDGKITLREALDYATQSLSTGETVASKIKFTLGGTIKLSSASQSLKIVSKSVAIDASDVGGITIQGNSSLLLYIFGGTKISPSSVSLKGLTLTGGKTTTANSKGAAIQLSSNCNLTVEACSIIGNQTSSGLGTGIYVGSGSLTLIDSVLAHNTSSGQASKGGAVYVESGSLVATRTSFSSNTSADGGAVFIKNGAGVFESCFFSGNSANSGDGGAIYSTGAVLNVDNLSFLNNASAGIGGAIYIDGEEETTLVDVKFIGNEAINGGAIYQDSQALTVRNAQFSDNKASENGGAVYIEQNAYINIVNGNFYSNSARLNGGAVYNDGSLYLSQAEIEANIAQKSGGAIYSGYYFEIREACFVKNTAGLYGGSVYQSIASSPSWILCSTINESQANEGAGVYSADALTLANVSFTNNTATTNGGGFANLGSMYIVDSKFVNNVTLGANGAGGAGLNYPKASLAVANTTFSKNTAPNGSGGAIANSGELSLSAVTIDENKAGNFGGGVYSGGSLKAQYVTFTNNKAQDGGAIATTYGSSAIIVGSTLWNNVASNNGGALYAYGATVFQNTIVAYNVASSAAVAAYYYDATATVEPDFDAASVVTNNYSIDEAPTKNINQDVVLIDAQTNEPIDSGIYFGTQAVLDSPTSKSIIIRNIGKDALRFSNFEELSNATSIFTYSLATEAGSPLDVNNTFTLAPNQSVILTVKSTPKNLGSKYVELNFTTQRVTEDNEITSNTKQDVAFHVSTEIAKSGSATTSVAKLPNSDANISVKEDGSFTVSLSKAPTENVFLYLRSSENALLSTDVLLFTPSNYNEPQRVTASLNDSYLRENNLYGDVTVSLQALSNVSAWYGSTFAKISLNVENAVSFIADNAIDLNAQGLAGTIRWDLNGDGNADVITYGDSVWIDSSEVTSETISAYKTKSGVTTVTNYDVEKLPVLPSAYGEATVFDHVPGMTRLMLNSTLGAIKNWRVDWGDGSQLSESDELGLSQLFSHCYTQDGKYTISVELIGSDGQTVSSWSTAATVHISGVTTTSNAIFNLNSELESSESPAVLDDAINLISSELTALKTTAISNDLYGPSLEEFLVNQEIRNRKAYR